MSTSHRQVFFLCLAAVVYVSASFAIAFISPSFGWDFLSYWGEKATMCCDKGGNFGSSLFVDRHPGTLPILYRLVSEWKFTDANSVTLLSLIFQLAMSIVFYLWSRLFLARAYSMMVALGLLAFFPLFENHILIGGYSEAIVSFFVVSSVLLGALAAATSRKNLFALSLFVGVMPIIVRNTGLAYALAPIGSLLFWALGFLSSVKRSILIIILIMIAGVIIYSGAVINLFNNKVGFGDGVLYFGGYAMLIRIPSALEIWTVISTAFFKNSSFSVAWLFFALVLLCALAKCNLRREPLFMIPVFSCLILLFEQVASLWFAYPINHAWPGSDTGFSRFLIPFFVLQLCFIPVLASAASSQASTTKPNLFK